MEHPNGTVPAILDDQLLEVARKAEARIDAINRIKSLALRVTNPYDWVDQNGKPYLQASGSEKVAGLFGISWRIEGPLREDSADGHFTYTYKGIFSLSGRSIEAVGSRNSRDGFFSIRHRYDETLEKKVPYDVPPSEIDEADVKKAAYTNCVGNGITRLLGIRNMKWEEIESMVSWSKDDVTSIQYGTRKPKKKPPARKKAPAGKDKPNNFDVKLMCPTGGPEAGNEVSTKYCYAMCKDPGPDKCEAYQKATAV